MIDLNLPPVFEAVHVERSLTRAGEVLNVTQPAVKQLARLRDVFGDPLFVRAGRGVAPTAKAETLIAPVREALIRLRSGLDPASAFDARTSERAFNIASRDTSSSAVIPRLVKRLEKIAPNVRLNFHVVERHDIPLELASAGWILPSILPCWRGRISILHPCFRTGGCACCGRIIRARSRR